MKVLVLSHLYPSTFNPVHGVFVAEQVAALRNRGLELKVVSPVPWSPFPINHLTSRWQAYSDIPTHESRSGVSVSYPRYLTLPGSFLFASSGWRMYYGIRKLVARIYDEFPFDLIQAHVALPDGFAAAELRQEYQVPLVVTIHGQDLQVTLNRSAACAKALASVFRQADRVNVVSTKLQKIAQSRIGFHNKIVVIGNGVTIAKLKPEANRSNPALHRDVSILSVSNLIRSKGIDLNLKAIAALADKHPRLRYTVIGDGPEMSLLVKLACDLNIQNRVAFLGRLSHEQVMDYMAATDVFCLPSWCEGFGVVYIEAMAHKKPVIACKGEGIEDAIIDGETGFLVEPKSVQKLVNVLEYVLDHPVEAALVGEKAHKLVLSSYTWEKNAAKTVEVYRKALSTYGHQH